MASMSCITDVWVQIELEASGLPQRSLTYVYITDTL